MSIHVLSDVLKHSKARLAARLVLISIADRANDEGYAWPRPSTIARDANISERQLRSVIPHLEDIGELQIVRAASRQKPPMYRVLVSAADSAGVSGEDFRYQRRGLPLHREPKEEPKEELSRAAEAAPVWEAWKKHHPAARYTPDRERLITKWLPYYPAKTLIDAIEGNHESDWHRGDNPTGKRYHDLGLILRNADHIEAFAELHNEPKGGKKYVDLQEALKNAQAAGFLA